MSKFNLQDAIVQSITGTLNEHNLRPPVDRSKGQVDKIIQLCDEYSNKTGNELVFDNSYANHYKLTLNGTDYEFSLYRDVINALTMLLV